MVAKGDSVDEQILGRLDALIYLELCAQIPEGRGAVVERVKRLDSAGLRPSEIAEIVGSSQRTVTSILSKARRKRR